MQFGFVFRVFFPMFVFGVQFLLFSIQKVSYTNSLPLFYFHPFLRYLLWSQKKKHDMNQAALKELTKGGWEIIRRSEGGK